MIKPQSNAPANMQPWIRTTDKQINDLERMVAKLDSLINGATSTDHEQNFNLNNVFSFTRQDDNNVTASAAGMNFTSDVTADGNIGVAGGLVVGDPTRQVTDDEGNAVGTVPNFAMTAGAFEINPVTGDGAYSAGVLNMNDSAVDLNVNGLISGDGLSINLSNSNQDKRSNIAIISVSGDGTYATYEIEKTDATMASYVAGEIATVVGVDPAVYNFENGYIQSVDSSGDGLLFTILNTATDSYVAGGYSTITSTGSVYEGKVSVAGPGPDYVGVTVDQNGVYVGPGGGTPATALASITSSAITATEVAVDHLNVDNTRVFVSSTAPSSPIDGDIWIDPTGSPAGGVAAPHAATHGASGSDPVTLAQSQIVNLTTDLAGKADTVHTHAISDVTDLQTTLDAKVDESSQTVTTGWLTASSGFGSVTGTYTEKNGIVMVNLRATRTGATIAAGNITNTGVMIIAAGYRPLVEAAAISGPSGPLASAYISTGGAVTLSALGTDLANGANIDINATYIKA